MITYNHAPYIAQAIEGVVKQETEYPFELIIGEDCSTDGTRDIVFEFQKKYPDIIRVITSDKNVGAKQNDYRTTKACRGKYIAFCDGDDYWHRLDKIQLQADYMEEHTKCGLICSDYDEYRVSSRVRINRINKSYKRNPANSDYKKIFEGESGIQTCTVMVRREILEPIINADTVLYHSDRFPVGDLPLWFEISYVSDVAYIDESMATYNYLPESATKSRDHVRILRVRIFVKELILYLIHKYELPEVVRFKHEEDLFDRKLKLALYEKDPTLADEVKRRKKRLTVIDRLKILGTYNATINSILRFYYCCGRFRDKRLLKDTLCQIFKNILIQK